MLAVSTGMRQGELLGLKWEDADLEVGTLQVRRVLSQTNDGPVLTPPKSAKSRRIELTAMAALKRQLEERMERGGL